MVEKGGPNRPVPEAISLASDTTAIAILDLGTRCHDPKMVCHKLMPAVAAFLDSARIFNIPIVFTISASERGTPLGEVAFPLKRREIEPVIYPDGFDKFVSEEFQDFLKQKNTKHLVILGASTNVAVLYTSTTAARIYRYQVIIPMDGVIARTTYEQEYAFHQLTVLPSGANMQVKFTTLSLISFTHL